MLEPQNEHFVRDFLNFSHFVASKLTFSHEFSHEPQNLLPQNRCFVRSFRQFHHISRNATPATEFARCHHLTQPWQCDSQKPATWHIYSAPLAMQNDDGSRQSPAPATPTQKYCACHTKRPSARYETCWNFTKCHACHAKRGYATVKTSKRTLWQFTGSGWGLRFSTRKWMLYKLGTQENLATDIKPIWGTLEKWQPPRSAFSKLWIVFFLRKTSPYDLPDSQRRAGTQSSSPSASDWLVFQLRDAASVANLDRREMGLDFKHV